MYFLPPFENTDGERMKILYIDIETAPNVVYTWGLFNQNVGLDQIVQSGHTLCYAAKWEDESEVVFSSTYHDGDDNMVASVWKLLDEADIVIHYNGRKFDMPILNKEFIKHGLQPPTPYQQVDLLETARRRFKFVSNKLDYVSQFLGLDSKVQHKGMSLWSGCMAGNDEDWELMKEYNIQDVRMLPDLYKALLPWIQDHPNLALYEEDDPEKKIPVRCTNCGSTHVKKNGVEHLKTQSYQRYKCLDCGTPLRGRSTIVPLEKRRATLTQSKL